MTYQDDFTLSAALLEQGSLEQLSTQGLGALHDLFPEGLRVQNTLGLGARDPRPSGR